jgi:hypothetical protein
MLAGAAGLAVANGVTGLPESVATWPADAILSAELRQRTPDPWPGSMGVLDLATLVAFDQAAENETLQALAVLLALAYAPGAASWRPR